MKKWQVAADSEVIDRVLAAANHEERDRVPVWDHLDNQAVFGHFKRPGDDSYQAVGRAYNALGIDVCRGYGNGMTRTITREDTAIESPEELIAEIQQWEDFEDWTDFASELIEHYYWMRNIFAPRTIYVPSGGTGLTELYTTIGFERFSIWLHDHPELIADALRYYAELNTRWTDLVARERLCPLIFIGEDIAANHGLLFRPSWLRKHFITYLKRICHPLAETGIKIIFHSDGNTMEILDELIDAGIDGLHPIEPAAGMDLAYLKCHYGENLILVGGVDANKTLPFGTKAEIQAAVEKCIKTAGRGGGYFIGSSGEIGPAVPLENALHFYKACGSCQS
jgi:hypothetical protein